MLLDNTFNNCTCDRPIPLNETYCNRCKEVKFNIIETSLTNSNFFDEIFNFGREMESFVY